MKETSIICVSCLRDQSLQVRGFVTHFDPSSSRAAVMSEIAFPFAPKAHTIKALQMTDLSLLSLAKQLSLFSLLR